MKSVRFERWWVDALLPHLPEKAAISIDNAKYHSQQTAASKCPTTAWRKAKIKKWLVRKSNIVLTFLQKSK